MPPSKKPDPAVPPRRPCMRRLTRLVPCVASLLLGGCVGFGPRQVPLPPSTDRTHYPAPIAHFGREDKFPLAVAGFRRGPAIAYAPGMVDYAIAYASTDPAVQSEVTLYFYPRMGDGAAQLRDEVQEVLQSHPGARLVDRRIRSLVREGAPYEAQVVDFQYDAVFHGRLQPVASRLVLVLRAQAAFKARSTAPLAEADAAAAALDRLLANVAWDAPEVFIGH